MSITYQKNGDYLMPNITMDKQSEKSIGKYGQMRKKYLMESKSGLYQSLLLTNKLTNHLIEINEEAIKRLELIEEQMKQEQSVNEELKEMNQMEWICKMNNIHYSAEEIVLRELILN